MKNKLRLIIIIFLLLASCKSSFAATKVGLSIDPAILRVQIKPAKSITKIFTIQNTEDTDKNLVARVIPFSKSDPLGNPIIDVKNVSEKLNFFSLSNSSIKLNEPFLLKAKSKEQLILSISIPETANLEDLYITLLVSTYNNSLETPEGTLVSASIGANVLVSITSEINPKTILKIDKITPSKGSIIKIGQRYFSDNLSPLAFEASVTNSGEFVTETKGTFRVSKKAEVLQLQGVLPQYVISKGTRKLISTDEKEFNFTPSLTTLGLHTVSIDIKSENSNTSNSIEIFFFPLKALLAVGFTILILKITLSFGNKKID